MYPLPDKSREQMILEKMIIQKPIGEKDEEIIADLSY